MILSLLSSFSLLASQAADIPSPVDVLRQHHLETVEGRLAFLNQELIPYMTMAAELNQEITEISQQIQALSPTDDKEKILSLSEYVSHCMDLMTWMLPSLDLAQHVEEDLAQIDTILGGEALSSEQQESADRLATLCLYIDQYNER